MISLYGKLGRNFEKEYEYAPKNIKINANSAAEAIRGMESNFPGFRELFRKGFYRVTRGASLTHGKIVNSQEVTMNFGDNEWHFMAVAFGGGGNSTLTIIAGIVILAAAIYFAPAAAVGGEMVAGGTLGAAMAAGGIYAFGVKLGVGLIIAGLSSLLSPAPGAAKGAKERPSYLFSGPANYVEPGHTIPVAYGETFIGSCFISGGLIITDIPL